MAHSSHTGAFTVCSKHIYYNKFKIDYYQNSIKQKKLVVKCFMIIYLVIRKMLNSLNGKFNMPSVVYVAQNMLK